MLSPDFLFVRIQFHKTIQIRNQIITFFYIISILQYFQLFDFICKYLHYFNHFMYSGVRLKHILWRQGWRAGLLRERAGCVAGPLARLCLMDLSAGMVLVPSPIHSPGSIMDQAVLTHDKVVETNTKWFRRVVFRCSMTVCGASRPRVIVTGLIVGSFEFQCWLVWF